MTFHLTGPEIELIPEQTRAPARVILRPSKSAPPPQTTKIPVHQSCLSALLRARLCGLRMYWLVMAQGSWEVEGWNLVG